MWSVSWDGEKMIECQLLPRTQRSLLLLSLYTLRDRYAGEGWALETPETAAEELTPGNLFVFVGDKLMCLSQSKPWFSAEYVITEEFVDEGIPLETVKAVCEAACRDIGIRRYTVGTRAAPNQRHAGLASLYQREGLTVSTVELMGVIHEQKDSQDRGEVRPGTPDWQEARLA